MAFPFEVAMKMDRINLFITVSYALGGLLVALFTTWTAICLLSSWVHFRTMCVLSRTPVTDISALSTGYYAVEGDVRAEGMQLTAPFSGKPCVSYQLSVTKCYTGTRSAAYVTEIVAQASIPWMLDDGTGQMTIDLHSDPKDSRADELFIPTTAYGKSQFTLGDLNKACPRLKTWTPRERKRICQVSEVVIQDKTRLHAQGVVTLRNGMRCLTSEGGQLVVAPDRETAVKHFQGGMWACLLLGSISLIPIGLIVWHFYSSS